MKVLAFAGSMRTKSFNKVLAHIALSIAQEFGHETEFLELRDYPLPPYDGDIEEAIGIPENALKMAEKIRAADAIILSAAEYNGSTPGVLKNVIDWVSRERKNPVCFNGQHLLLISASPSGFGGVRGQWATRIPLEMLNTYVYPQMMPVSLAHEAFDENNQFKDAAKHEQLKKLVETYLLHVQKYKIGAMV